MATDSRFGGLRVLSSAGSRRNRRAIRRAAATMARIGRARHTRRDGAGADGAVRDIAGGGFATLDSGPAGAAPAGSMRRAAYGANEDSSTKPGSSKAARPSVIAAVLTSRASSGGRRSRWRRTMASSACSSGPRRSSPSGIFVTRPRRAARSCVSAARSTGPVAVPKLRRSSRSFSISFLRGSSSGCAKARRASSILEASRRATPSMRSAKASRVSRSSRPIMP